jgi:hypothetical protein
MGRTSDTDTWVAILAIAEIWMASIELVAIGKAQSSDK